MAAAFGSGFRLMGLGCSVSAGLDRVLGVYHTVVT